MNFSHRPRRATLLAAGAAAVALSVGAGAPDASAFRLDRVVSGLTEPVYVTSPPEDASRLYVVERAGRIKLVEGGRTTTVLDISDAVADEGLEEGLLSLAIAPDGRYFIAYTARAGRGNDLIVEQRRFGSPAVHEVLRIAHPASRFQNGGQVTLGPDGQLWIATGDGGYEPTLDNPAGRTDNLHGKLLRITPNVDAPGYTVPRDNPFARGGGRPEIWAYGLRNPWRFSFDRATGDLALGDVGAQRQEEIDIVRAADGRGRGVTFGWPRFEGTGDQGDGRAPANLVTPRVTHAHAAPSGWTAVTGGFVVRDQGLPERGRYVYGDYGTGRMFVLDLGCASARPVQAAARVDGLASFGENAAGHVYAVSIANGTVD
ncbi:MAG TPA: PQQ-dependent sugar dehydrogenase, partial [Solirubrobacteraceae bacterium]|nr:PQQ-dependent sugar dehydrogenase [Solirubrobacteraceae bacterium]